MHSDDSFQQQTARQSVLHQAVTGKSVSVARGTDPGNATLATTALHFLPLGFVFGWMVVLIWFTRWRAWHSKNQGGGLNSTLDGRRSANCKNCMFFKDNPYIKCAVNPTLALTKQSRECLDYVPQQNRFAPRGSMTRKR